MHLSNEDQILEEFQELMSIAQELLLDMNTKDLTIELFMQLCLDIRNAERDVDLDGKNIVIPIKDIIQ